ncbi:unnamed protein product [Effrenium voratum]|nr:unnamed protein product [Effrenium voratum]
MAALECSCGFSSYSKIIFQDHSCAGEQSRYQSDRWSQTYGNESRTDETGTPPPPPPPPEEEGPPPPGTVDVYTEEDFRNPQNAPFRCICGFSAFSQLLYEDHECHFVMREAVKSSVRASSVSRLKDAGLHLERLHAPNKEVPQTVVVKSQETGKVIFGPRPVEKDSNIAKLQEKILEMRKQPWASMRFFYEERELDSETKLQSLLETSLTLMADVNSDSLDISVHKSYFNKFPDVITEIVVSQRKEEEFQDYVTTIREKLRPVCGRFRTNCSCVRGDIQSVDPAIVLKSIEDKPRNMSCVPFLSCLSSEEHGRVQAFLQKAKDARMWKHESFGQHYLLVWAAGHELRLAQ